MKMHVQSMKDSELPSAFKTSLRGARARFARAFLFCVVRVGPFHIFHWHLPLHIFMHFEHAFFIGHVFFRLPCTHLLLRSRPDVQNLTVGGILEGRVKQDLPQLKLVRGTVRMNA